MTSLIPLSNFDRMLARSLFPSESFDQLFDIAEPSATAFKMDVEDAGDEYVVTAHVPGVTRDQIDVELNEGRLSITIDKQETEEEKEKTYIHKEIRSYRASRGVYLKDAAVSGLSAQLVDGVLSVHVPKQKEKANVTKITID